MTDFETFWEPETLRAAAGGGRWLRRPLDASARIVPDGLGTDSRTLSAGQVFLALCGERFDGHDHLDDAVDRGAAMLIVHRPPGDMGRWPPNLHVLLVEDTLKALARLAAAYRRRLGPTRFIAVTGSSGKTTTKQMLLAVLGRRFRVSGSPKSFNNHIGVPLTILAAQPRDQYVVCEVGTNHPGEIADLASIVEPDIAIITSIGRVHLEGLGSVEGVASEKAAILGAMAHGGWAAICIDEPAILPHIEPMERGITFGFSTDADLRICQCSVTTAGTTFTLNDRTPWRLPLYGMHHASNATAAIAVGRRCGLTDAEIQAGLLTIEAPEMRFVLHRLGRLELFDDCYNANPESMKASIRTFRRLVAEGAGRGVVILGDMLELGDLGPAAHAEVAEELLDESEGLAPPRLAILIGPLMRTATEALEREARVEVHHADDLNEATIGELVDLLGETDRVLVKGSRGMKLERIVAAVRERFDALRRSSAPAAANSG